jgi:hypothetical protein
MLSVQVLAEFALQESAVPGCTVVVPGVDNDPPAGEHGLHPAGDFMPS